MTETCQHTSELTSAYLDNELSATECLALERHLRECAQCAQEVAALAELSSKIKTQGHYHAAPPELMNRVCLATATAATPQARGRFQKPGFWSGWRPMASATAVVLLLGFALWQFTGNSADTRFANEILSSHIRSTLSQQPFDVAAADRHTVKPWFQGKLNFVPPVIDLSAQGFNLQGGRLDFIDGQTIPVIVYGRRKHMINLYISPSSDPIDRPARNSSANGYNLVDWRRGGMRLTAISDLTAAELLEFTRLFTSQADREARQP